MPIREGEPFIPLVRKPFVHTPESLQADIDDYFARCPNEQLTITGLALATAGNRSTFYEYQQRPEFAAIIAAARLRVENAYELSLRKNGRTGDIFALKQFGWRDGHEEYEQKRSSAGLTINIQLVQPGALAPDLPPVDLLPVPDDNTDLPAK